MALYATGYTRNQERYIAAVFRLQTERNHARVKDIAKLLGLKAPTVTNAVKTLAQMGIVNHERYGIVSLTGEGEQVARELGLRRQAMRQFLHEVLRVPPAVAEEVAAEVEHSLPPSVLCRLVQFNAHYDRSVTTKYEWDAECAELCRERLSSDCVLTIKRTSKKRP